MNKVNPDNYIACLLGGAIGDALGAPVEFMDINEIRNRYCDHGVTDFVEFPGSIGEFTDDTQMTLFTAEGLLRAAHRANLKGIGGTLHYITYTSYLRWLHTQGIDPVIHQNLPWRYDLDSGWLIKQRELYHTRAPGNTCISALSSGKAGTIDDPLNNSKGCGTIMRMAPVGLMFYGQNEHAFATACELSAITHGHPCAYLSAGFFASMISDLAAGINLEDAINNAISILKDWKKHDETLRAVDQALELFSNKLPGNVIAPEIIEKHGRGWTAEEALSISIFVSLCYKNDYKGGVLAAVNHSGDSDSTGSIVGNVLGLLTGLGSVPEKWIKNLKYSNIVKQIAEDLYAVAKGEHMHPDDEWWEKYAEC